MTGIAVVRAVMQALVPAKTTLDAGHSRAEALACLDLAAYLAADLTPYLRAAT